MKKNILMFIILFIILVTLSWILIWRPPFIIYWQKYKIANKYIEKIEQFRQQNQRLPSSLEEIGEITSEKGPIYYQKLSETEYQIWFGTTVGESIIYNSKTKKWN